ncbi:MAG: hypothetical protein J6Y48_10515 [Clostridia bacterium]|nr:hypothetical protein [Clostridia bacterium]
MLKQGTNDVVLPGIAVAFVGGEVVYHKLPSGYTGCEYVRGNANAWFSTGLYMTSEGEVIADLQYEGSAGNTYGCYTGSSASDNFCLYAGSSSNGYIRYNGQLARAFTPSSGTRYKIIHNKDGFWANGTQQAQAFTASTFTCSSPFMVGQLSGSTSAKFKGRIYRLTVKENGVVVMDLVPAKNSSDVYGLYDVIGRQFYVSEGTDFTGA